MFDLKTEADMRLYSDRKAAELAHLRREREEAEAGCVASHAGAGVEAGADVAGGGGGG
ncbi:hypothetical protein ACSNOK_27975 [Streptomyces sp. URMC 126]|uniref:hypothetical protein n=1 Tax=Streptomyces sp. URMC 126 TaxID=3423401 RepID=UPI003F1AFA2A